MDSGDEEVSTDSGGWLKDSTDSSGDDTAAPFTGSTQTSRRRSSSYSSANRESGSTGATAEGPDRLLQTVAVIQYVGPIALGLFAAVALGKLSFFHAAALSFGGAAMVVLALLLGAPVQLFAGVDV